MAYLQVGKILGIFSSAEKYIEGEYLQVVKKSWYGFIKWLLYFVLWTWTSEGMQYHIRFGTWGVMYARRTTLKTSLQIISLISLL